MRVSRARCRRRPSLYDPPSTRWRFAAIGMVFQRPNPFPTMSIYENVLAAWAEQLQAQEDAADDVVERSLRTRTSGTRSRTG